MSQSAERISAEEMWKTLEKSGVKREMLERLHPTYETLFHLYASIKKQRDVGNFKL